MAGSHSTTLLVCLPPMISNFSPSRLENRPKVMTAEWLTSHSATTLLSSTAAPDRIPAYTLYLAEMVRRGGGRLLFFAGTETMADTFRKIAKTIRAEYMLGFYPATNSTLSPLRRAGIHCALKCRSSREFVGNIAAYYALPAQ